MYLCYREPAPGYISKPTSARRFIMTSAPASTTAPPLQSSLRHRLLPWSRLRHGRAAVLLFPVLPCISVALCFSWRFHSQSTKFVLEFHAQSTRVCPGDSMPSRLSLFWRVHAQSITVFLVHHSRTHVLSCTTHESRALLSCTTHELSCTTLMHHSRAPLT